MVINQYLCVHKLEAHCWTILDSRMFDDCVFTDQPADKQMLHEANNSGVMIMMKMPVVDDDRGFLVRADLTTKLLMLQF